MNIGVIGSGVVGQTLAAGFLEHGHKVAAIGTRDPLKLADWAAKLRALRSDPSREPPISAMSSSWRSAARRRDRRARLHRRRGDRRQDHHRRLQPDRRRAAGRGRAQLLHRAGTSRCWSGSRTPFPMRIVKALQFGRRGQMVDPRLQGDRPTMFICGDNADAKKTVAGICDAFGWEARAWVRSRRARHRAAVQALVDTGRRKGRLVATRAKLSRSAISRRPHSKRLEFDP